jgi:tetratricopeptide (TPR) repeat protein
MGRTQEALARAADPATTVAPLELAETAMTAGRDEDAVIWFRLAAERGDSTALRGAAVVLVRLGRAEEALALLLRYAERGDVFAMGEAGWLLGELGRDEAALTWYLRAVEAGDGFAQRCVARLLARTGREAEARAWYRRAALEKGDRYALEEEQGKRDGVDGAPGIPGTALIGYGWNAEMPWLLARVRGTDQRSQEPPFAIDGLDLDFLVMLRTLAQEAQHGGTFGVLHEADDILGALREHDLFDEAVAWCWSRATEGSPYGAWWTAAHRLLQAQGRADEAQRLRRFGWEPDGSVAEPWEALPPEEPLVPAALVRDSDPLPRVEECDQGWWRVS